MPRNPPIAVAFKSAVLTLSASIALAQPGGVVIEMVGTAHLQRLNWRAPSATSVGVALQKGDLLRLPKGSDLTVMCSNFSTFFRLPAGQTSAALRDCPQTSAAPSVINSQRLLSPRGRSTGCSVLEPRGLVLASRPRIRFSCPDPQSSHVVRLVQSGWRQEIVWGPTVVEGSEVEYPAWAEALRPSVLYEVQVKGVGEESYPQPGVAFQIVGSEERARARLSAVVEAIERSPLSERGRALAISVFLLKHGLKQDALARLDRWPDDGPGLLLLRADLLNSLARTREARAAYQMALSSAAQHGDLESEARACLALAELTTRAGEPTLLRDRAKSLLSRLGSGVSPVDLFTVFSPPGPQD